MARKVLKSAPLSPVARTAIRQLGRVARRAAATVAMTERAIAKIREADGRIYARIAAKLAKKSAKKSAK